MNTPEPCVNCKHLYYDCNTKDSVDYFEYPCDYIQCKLDLPIGNKSCPKFKHWHRDMKQWYKGLSVQFAHFTKE